MRLLQEDLLKKFIKEIKEDYPQYTDAQLKEACKAQFKYYGNEMKKGTLNNIRIMHIGSFIVRYYKVTNMIIYFEKLKEKGLKTAEECKVVFDRAVNYYKEKYEHIQEEKERKRKLAEIQKNYKR